jgi:hypothetical protein
MGDIRVANREGFYIVGKEEEWDLAGVPRPRSHSVLKVAIP